ncbi:DUF481 domain-containing protein [Bowmanella dokdonensis]|uniref:DUF481 domain-containing protein n=1 Tax=Bowmanella dokdonensis TaxID=751969 RepID=A0A939DKX2_9ALTE|nr:DUF481 domain-containing protein [Bowmanella dokdonensis]MBN7824187.1 DUF481 domain-containing protein [Bowmanella dokdonensis]
MIQKTSLALCAALFVSSAVHADALDELFAPDISTPEEADKPFSMDAELGLILTTGNTESSAFNGKLNAHQELESWSNDYIIEGFYKEDEVTVEVDGESTTEQQTTAQKIFMSGQGNYKLENPNHRLFAFASYEDDRFSGYAHQATIAAGWAQQLWKNANSSFSYSIGPGYSFAEKEDGESANSVIVRGAMDYKWKISDTSTFRQLFSTEVGSDNTKSKSETSVAARINGSLALKVALILNHNTDVDPGIEELDTQTSVTLVYTFF